MVSRFLQAVRPFMSITPEVVKPEKEVRFNEKVMWTFAALIIYFVMSAVPVYGYVSGGDDPFVFMRVIMASQRGTLAELGIGPIVTAGLIMQILVGSKIIGVDMSDPEQRSLYTGAQKVLSVFMTIFEAGAYIIGGAYGPGLAADIAMIITAQLVVAGIIIILLDEMVQKGWGLGSGISLFIAGGVATSIFWNLFFFDLFTDGLPRGAFIAILTVLFSGPENFLDGFSYLFLRDRLPANSIFAIFVTIVVFIVVVYFESMRIEIPVSYSQYRGFRAKYPIKLLYVSNIPVILTSAVFADVYFIAQMIWNGSGGSVPSDGGCGWTGNLLVDFLGVFTSQEGTGLVPCGGLVWFLTPPRGIVGDAGVFSSVAPLNFPRAMIYAVILIILSIGFSKMWIETAGMGARDVSSQLLGAGMQIPGWRRSKKIVEKRLDMYIPAAATVGGLFIGILAAGADFMGAMGTGIGILLSVSIMRQYFEILVKERAAEMHPALRDFLGIM